MYSWQSAKTPVNLFATVHNGFCVWYTVHPRTFLLPCALCQQLQAPNYNWLTTLHSASHLSGQLSDITNEWQSALLASPSIPFSTTPLNLNVSKKHAHPISMGQRDNSRYSIYCTPVLFARSTVHISCTVVCNIPTENVMCAKVVKVDKHNNLAHVTDMSRLKCWNAGHMNVAQ